MPRIFKIACVVVLLWGSAWILSFAQGTSSDSITWWEAAAVEIRLGGTVIMVDPCFPFYRNAHAILVTHAHGDHCHIPTIERIRDSSGQMLHFLAGPYQCREKFAGIAIAKKTLLGRGESITLNGITIETIPSFEADDDIGYIIRDAKKMIGI
ncbi:MAG: MBL fold metallo-hydrolase, partial [Candidatus Omnitrophica bacterium]|nr:MBL fold metallo-hydrolase [Candidatus Omnitrophota bacterium]